MNTIDVVGYERDELENQAITLAKQLNFRLEKDANPSLFLTAEKLTLRMPDFSPLYADFSVSNWNKRRAEGKKQGLIRACKPTPGLKIIDATAGWGRDAAILASFGAEVLMLERHPVIAALLSDALLRRSALDEKQMNLSLREDNSYSFLSNLKPEQYPDVIYIDPMHPERHKSALVKKDMQALQQMIGADGDAQKLIELAISRVKQRVVVKWPQKVAPLVAANACIAGKTVRFDLYWPEK